MYVYIYIYIYVGLQRLELRSKRRGDTAARRDL